MAKIIKLTEGDLQKLVKETANKILKEGIQPYENVNVFDVLNDNFDGDWREILTANVYNKEGQCLGQLREMHFVYDTKNNKLDGSY